MNFTELKKLAHTLYFPALLLEDSIHHAYLHTLEQVLRILAVLSLVSSGLLVAEQKFLHGTVVSFGHIVYGVSALIFCAWILVFLLESFYYSYVYSDGWKGKKMFMDFDLASSIHTISENDITKTFFNSDIGRFVLMRCGVSQDVFQDFLKKRTSILGAETLQCRTTDTHISFTDFAEALFDHDASLSQFLFSYGIQKKEFIAVVDWIVSRREASRDMERFWSEENLSRIPGIGQGWDYGNAYTLKKYERYLPPTTLPRYEVHSSYGVEELKEIEAVLSRTRGANALLVGNDIQGNLQIVSHLAGLINENEVLASLKHKKVVVFDHDVFISANSTKAQFETELITILRESISAGNIILVFPDFSTFVLSSQTLGSDMASLLEPYLASPHFQIIALSDTARFHEVLEKNTLLMQHFESILVKEIDDTNTIKVLENEIIKFEHDGMYFTYQAIEAIATSAERYFADAIMPDKAIDLLLEIVPKLRAKGKRVVEKSDVLDLIEVKTGIPVGEVRSEEKDKLLNLEEILHKRIIGQDQAVVAISNAVRRARSGVSNPNRPLSSFLFLGPTGVGKTETTKALAEVFFGTDAHIMRLDMSEYSSFDSTSKLIGSFESNHTGVLSSMLREHPYGVLLLDEFEKTTKEVMNLFLQILDEGFFSDMSGKRINARNLIIIATSNAGSDLIWEAVKSGSDVMESKDKIIDTIITEGIFKPELLNRFDGVIMFHPLKDEHLRKIAELMLQKLHTRLAERGMNLVVDETLINFVMSYGTDPKFGARPINRAIQEEVEQLVAKKIISGSLQPGSQIVLTSEELHK
ncbi:MAG: ATP-dependent Clp protease ATP-binding subunit [Patescibacteria group bacterium]